MIIRQDPVYIYRQLIPRWKRRKHKKLVSRKVQLGKPIVPFIQSPTVYKQLIPKWKHKKYRRINFKRMKIFEAWFVVVLPKIMISMQPYRYKQYFSKWRYRKLTKFRRLVTYKKTPRYEMWNYVPPVTVDVFGFVLDPYKLKQYFSKWKYKIRHKRSMNLRRGNPKYDTYRAVIAIAIFLTIGVNLPSLKTESVHIVDDWNILTN